MLKDDRITLANGTVVSRIRALRDIVGPKGARIARCGDLGGYIEKEQFNLDHRESCWVGGNAVIFGSAQVTGNALISDDAMVYGGAVVLGNARVQDKARVGGSALVGGCAVVGGNAQIDRFQTLKFGQYLKYRPAPHAGRETARRAESGERLR